MTILVPPGDLSALDSTPAPVPPASGGDTPARAPAAPSPYAHGGDESLGFLLDEKDEQKVCTHVEQKLWKAQDRRLKRLDPQWVVNEHVRDGMGGARVLTDPETGLARAYVPLGATRVGISKTEQLCRKIVATLFVDPPLPEATPSSGEDKDRAAAELATRILRDEASEAGVNLREDAETATDLAGTYGSGFVWAFVNPQGGGWVPMQVQAHATATHFDDEHPEAVLVDPATGEPSATYVPRYVAADGSLSDDAVGARRAWRAAIEDRHLTGRNLRFLPETARGIRDARGVVICQVETIGALKEAYESVAAMPEDALQALVSWRPATLAKVLPPGLDVEGDGKATTDDGTVSDAALVMTLTVVYRSHGAYPEGAYCCVGGGKFVLHRQSWVGRMGEGDDERDEPLDLPVAQFRQFTDRTGRNPYGTGAAQRLGPGDEIRATQLAAWLDHLDRFNHPNTFLPLGSVIQPGALARRDGTPIPFNAEAGAPVHEQVPDFPRAAVELYTAMGAEMNSESGLEETAQGVDTETAQSGVAKQLVVEQALTALSGVKANVEEGLVRLCRIHLQLTRAFVDTAQILKYAGEDGGHRVREWTRADLRSTRDVRIARGSFTMLSRSAKQALARDELNAALSTQNPQVAAEAYSRYQRLTAGTVDPLLGLEDDPHRLRIKRQVGQWLEGAEDLEEQPDAAAPAGAAGAAPAGPMGQLGAGNGAAAMPPQAPAVGGVPSGMPTPANPAPPAPMGAPPMGGQPMGAPGMPGMLPPMPPPADPRAVAIFAPLPVDEEPTVAQVRHEELARVMAGSRYQTLPPAWRQPFDQEYARMKLCAGIQTVPEQQAAAQQQALAQAQQQQQQQAQHADQQAAQQQGQQQHQAQLAAAQRAHDADQSRADRDAAAARDSHRVEAQQAAVQMRAELQNAARQGTALDPGANPAALMG